MIPERQRILQKIPDYAVDIEPSEKQVTVSYDGKVIAQSNRALVIRETRHAEAIYLPRDDVQLARFKPTEHSTYCPFKGHASYWSLELGDGTTEDNVVWSYDSPYPEVADLKGYLSFYTDRTAITVA